jgi:hypothetical protein
MMGARSGSSQEILADDSAWIHRPRQWRLPFAIEGDVLLVACKPHMKTLNRSLMQASERSQIRW